MDPPLRSPRKGVCLCAGPDAFTPVPRAAQCAAPTKYGERSVLFVGAGPRPARGRTLCAPTVETVCPHNQDLFPHPSGLTASPPTPFGLQPFPPDRGNRLSPKGERFWAAKGRSYGENRTGSVNSARPGADAKPQQLQFPSRSGPQWGRTEPHPSTPVLGAGNVLPTSRGNPVTGVRGPTPPVRGRCREATEGVG